jgi:hypothetical protein
MSWMKPGGLLPSLIWCTVRPAADGCLEKEGTTKGVPAEIREGWMSVTLGVFVCRKLVRG